MIGSTDQAASESSASALGAGWLDYVPHAETPDECMEAGGRVRPNWDQLLSSLDELGLSELTRRWEQARHLIRENGVTYNVYGDPRGTNRPWQLDPIPCVLAADTAALLQQGLSQRGRLLEAVVRDVYGPQGCLAEGLLPREFVFGNRAFLRPCHGIAVPGGHYLHLYGANLGRGADGQFYVLGDRTQSPSGAGYALENRIVMTRMLPETFRDCRVQRLAPFFRTLRDTLRSIAPHNRDNPRIVLLTPGPFNETYFEHAYLARYLGYTLVEGGDLTVRDNRVYLKVLGGLQPVDVIFRRVDDDFCDPLELRADSFLGVAGVVQAMRAGHVAVANALGSGLLEAPSLLAFLPALCRRLLGEELRLPSVPTWWCGDPASRELVISRLSDMVIKPAFAGVRLEPAFGDELTADQRAELAARIRARPHEYVGQERLTLSTTPVLVNDRLQPRHLVLRAYLAAHGDEFEMMPGGLSRVSGSADTMIASMQRGGGSKDSWVLSSGPVSDVSLLPRSGLPVALSRGGNDLPSRVADNLFWMGRYAERADALTRLLRGALVRMTETSGLAESPELPALLRAVTVLSESPPGFVGEGAAERLRNPEAELLAVIYDRRRPGSVVSVLEALGRTAGTVRDRVSKDMWRVLSALADFRAPVRAQGYHEAAADADGDEFPAGRTLSAALERLDRIVLTLAAFGGLAMESVTRGYGWRFLDMGRRLERSHSLVNLLRHTLVAVADPEPPLLEALLEVADSSMTYRRRYQGSLQAAAVLDLLLADETNPRALAFQLAALSEDVDHLPRDVVISGRSPEQRLVLSALTAVRLADADVLVEPDHAGRRAPLERLLEELAATLPALSEAITQTHLSHLQAARQLAAWPK
ncbi:MAG: circularly permuted type 2 ATP-grasp protein [Planctomycetaceae bacterium]